MIGNLVWRPLIRFEMEVNPMLRGDSGRNVPLIKEIVGLHVLDHTIKCQATGCPAKLFTLLFFGFFSFPGL